MSQRILSYPFLAAAALASGAATSCVLESPSSTTGGGTGGHPTGTLTSLAGGGGLGGGGFATGSTSGTVITGPCNLDPDVDGDGDGWTPAQGDCDDCNRLVNPGAVDVLLALDGGAAAPVDQNCDDVAALPATCDAALGLEASDARTAARALDLCDDADPLPKSPQERRPGLLAARWVSASGDESRDPGAQAGLFEVFGTRVRPVAGASLLALSTGRARVPGQPGACNADSCWNRSNVAPPASFPQIVPGCDGGTIINDDVALEVDLRAPTNATGLSFALKFHSFEYPAWVCTEYNDQFVALLRPAPQGSVHGNIAFDALKNPISVNLVGLDVCDPATLPEFAQNCASATCPTAPGGYCTASAAELEGTGFDAWGELGAGATPWLVSRAPVGGGSEVTLRFALWDTTDQALDSTVLLDGFTWLTGAAVAVGTGPQP